jgi:hypothetical protein
VRSNNPGAQWPNADSKAFGSTGSERIGGGNLIANFPTPVHGAAANMQLLDKKYTGMTVGAAIKKWSGNGRGEVPGYRSDQVITHDMARDPKFAVPFMKSLTRGEAPGKYPMSDAQWAQAHDWSLRGTSEGQTALARNETDAPDDARSRVAGPGAGNPPGPPTLEERSSKSPYPDVSEAPAQPTIPPQAAGFDDRVYDRSRVPSSDDDQGAPMSKAAGKGLGPGYGSQEDYLARPPGELSARSNQIDAEAMKVEGTGKIDVSVSAPKGTKVAAEGGGLFRQVSVARTTPMSPAPESTGGGEE